MWQGRYFNQSSVARNMISHRTQPYSLTVSQDSSLFLKGSSDSFSVVCWMPDVCSAFYVKARFKPMFILASLLSLLIQGWNFKSCLFYCLEKLWVRVKYISLLEYLHLCYLKRTLLFNKKCLWLILRRNMAIKVSSYLGPSRFSLPVIFSLHYRTR